MLLNNLMGISPKPFPAIGGIAIIENPHMSATRVFPKRKHKGNERAQYSKRIQKKWNKRYGVEERVCIWRIDDNAIACRPSIKKPLSGLVWF